MDELIKFLGVFTIGTISVVSLIGYFGKQLVSWYFQKKQKEFQNTLSKDLKEFEAQLKNTSHRYQVRFSNLHTEQGLVIKELYKLIVKLEFSTTNFINKAGTAQETIQDLDSLKLYYYTTELFLTDDINDQTKKIINTFVGVWADYATHLSYGNYNDLDIQHKKEKAQFAKEARKSLQQDIPQLKADLKRQFQSILGVDQV